MFSLLNLNGSPSDGLAFQFEGPRVAMIETRDDLDQGGFAGTVLAHKGVDRAWVKHNVAGTQRDDRTKRLRDVMEFEGRNPLIRWLWHLRAFPFVIETLQKAQEGR